MAKDKTTVKYGPQAHNDQFSGVEHTAMTLDVLANDEAGNGKSLYSVNQADPSLVAVSGLSAMGAAISMVNGKITYSADSAAITALAAGQHATDTFTYTIQMGNNGTLSQATVSVNLTGISNAAPIQHFSVAAVTSESGVALDFDSGSATLTSDPNSAPGSELFIYQTYYGPVIIFKLNAAALPGVTFADASHVVPTSLSYGATYEYPYGPDTFVVKTDQGHYYALGNFDEQPVSGTGSETVYSLAFDYQFLS